ncbi:hypothetical protein I4U23_004318 [Adineta vaga]|nr:hypothetical protein I4U23_004318 [Adineta vaga]
MLATSDWDMTLVQNTAKDLFITVALYFGPSYIIIVRNSMVVQTIEDSEKIIKEEIEYLFDAKLRTMKLKVNNTSNKFNFFPSKQDNINLRHFIFARDDYDATKIWNRQSVDGIMNIFYKHLGVTDEILMLLKKS